jgi:hypothetical protein
MIKPTGLLSKWLLLLALVGYATPPPPPKNVDRPPSIAFSNTGDTAMEIAIAEETSNHPGQSDFLLLEKQFQRLSCPGGNCRFAERSIDVPYYL